jgi:hypothetical protein
VTTTPWQPLDEREAGTPPAPVIHEGVPPHLVGPLRDWVAEGLLGGRAGWVALRLQIAIDPRDRSGGIETLAYRTTADMELLRVIDAMLALDGPWPRELTTTGMQHRARQMRSSLAAILDEGASVYLVDVRGKRLVRREDPTSTAALGDTTRAAGANPIAGSAAEQIRAAWDAIHALHPDPPAAYRAAVSAVESAAHIVIEPQNSAATMGSMLRQMRDNPGRYALAIPGPSGAGNIEPLIGMMRLLWQGQTSRHGSQNPQRLETFEEAQMAVNLAVTLVHWFTTGSVRRIS